MDILLWCDVISPAFCIYMYILIFITHRHCAYHVYRNIMAFFHIAFMVAGHLQNSCMSHPFFFFFSLHPGIHAVWFYPNAEQPHEAKLRSLPVQQLCCGNDIKLCATPSFHNSILLCTPLE